MSKLKAIPMKELVPAKCTQKKLKHTLKLFTKSIITCTKIYICKGDLRAIDEEIHVKSAGSWRKIILRVISYIATTHWKNP